jgi:hypothetical protein
MLAFIAQGYHAQGFDHKNIPMGQFSSYVAHGIFDQLNWKMELSGKKERFSLADAEWGRLPNGHVVGKPCRCFRGSKP